MAGLKLTHIYKVYPNGVKAVNDFTMEIEDKEFIVFVGPSGCGKSTTLRMIAGLEEITAGELKIGDAIVNDVEPKDRDIAMVFQNYALYPHMTVYENMAFGLKLRKVPKEEIDRKIKEAAQILGITEYLNRKPAAMSGGQRQRVALGRAIVREPKVFLLDEPLSNLDAKLRTQMRSEISKLHHKLQTTFIYVTHDQVEAMTMGTRIVVMKDGFIQQIDSPRNLYNFPGNKFVAGFIGTPQMNFFNGRLKLDGDTVTVSLDGTGVALKAAANIFDKTDLAYLDGEKPVIIGLRAEHLSIGGGAAESTAKCRVTHLEELGTECLVYADFNLEKEDGVSESNTRVIIKAPAGTEYEIGEVIDVSFNLTYVKAFDAETEDSIIPRIPANVVVDAEIKGGKLKMLGANIALPSAINVADGKYTVKIPVAAITLGGSVKTQTEQVENVNGKLLAHIRAGNRTIFSLVRDAEEAEKAQGVSIDLKRITISDANGAVWSPVPETSALDGKLVRNVVTSVEETDGRKKTVKEAVYSVNVCGHDMICGLDLVRRLVSGAGTEIFRKDLKLEFAPDVPRLGESGVEAKVEEILDFGDEKFAKCTVGEKTVFVKSSDLEVNQTVYFTLDPEKLAITEAQRDIRLT